MNDNDLNLAYSITTIDANKEIKLSGISTPSGKRFFDNSMLDVYRVCPRKFYFRHIRQFETSGLRIPLIFGTAWHAAMDIVWSDPKNPNIWQLAMAAFTSTWIKGGLKDTSDFDIFPRTPTRASEMLTEYIKRYADDINRVEVLAVETPFIVPLQLEGSEIFYIGKWDKVYKDRLGVTILDHKTASAMQNSWLASFSPNGQMDGYLFAGHLTYGEEMHGVMIDGALVSKTKIDFCRVPLQRQLPQLDAWLWEVGDLIDTIELNEERLLEYRNSSEKVNHLEAFPKCTTSCTQYFGICPYHDLCQFWQNPEDHQIPDNFSVSTWTPFAITEKLDGTLDIKSHGE